MSSGDGTGSPEHKAKEQHPPGMHRPTPHSQSSMSTFASLIMSPSTDIYLEDSPDCPRSPSNSDTSDATITQEIYNKSRIQSYGEPSFCQTRDILQVEEGEMKPIKATEKLETEDGYYGDDDGEFEWADEPTDEAIVVRLSDRCPLRSGISKPDGAHSFANLTKVEEQIDEEWAVEVTATVNSKYPARPKPISVSSCFDQTQIDQSALPHRLPSQTSIKLTRGRPNRDRRLPFAYFDGRSPTPIFRHRYGKIGWLSQFQGIGRALEEAVIESLIQLEPDQDKAFETPDFNQFARDSLKGPCQNEAQKFQEDFLKNPDEWNDDTPLKKVHYAPDPAKSPHCRSLAMNESHLQKQFAALQQHEEQNEQELKRMANVCAKRLLRERRRQEITCQVFKRRKPYDDAWFTETVTGRTFMATTRPYRDTGTEQWIENLRMREEIDRKERERRRMANKVMKTAEEDEEITITEAMEAVLKQEDEEKEEGKKQNEGGATVCEGTNNADEYESVFDNDGGVSDAMCVDTSAEKSKTEEVEQLIEEELKPAQAQIIPFSGGNSGHWFETSTAGSQVKVEGEVKPVDGDGVYKEDIDKAKIEEDPEDVEQVKESKTNKEIAMEIRRPTGTPAPTKGGRRQWSQNRKHK